MQEIISYLNSCITSATCDDSTIKITKDQMDKILLKHQLHCALKMRTIIPLRLQSAINLTSPPNKCIAKPRYVLNQAQIPNHTSID